MLTANPITAQRAHDIGFVHEIVDVADGAPGAAVDAAADDLARHMASLAPLALAGEKLGLDLLEQRLDVSDAEGRYQAAFQQAWASEDLVEGRAAFGERRPPAFRGR